LAADAQVDRAYVSQIETLTYNPTIAMLDKLAAALGIDVSEFLNLPDPNEPELPPLKKGPQPGSHR